MAWKFLKYTCYTFNLSLIYALIYIIAIISITLYAHYNFYIKLTCLLTNLINIALIPLFQFYTNMCIE